jgi:uncharacterized YigZ family protein
MNSFKTVKCAASDEYAVSKSRFIGHAAPAETEEAALAYLKLMRQEYHDATHNCYAYVIGQNAGIMRYSDDGEPGGTAGLPMMEVIRTRGVTNVCIVVTRYFGGILLGAGGLVRAYSHTCALALDAAQVAVMEKSQRWWVEIAYPQWDKVMHHIKTQPVLVEKTEFAATVTGTLLIREKDAPAVLSLLDTWTDGQAEKLLIEESYTLWQEEKL